MSEEAAQPWNDEEWQARAREFARRVGLEAEHDVLAFRALTHRSLAEEAEHGDNERLEFLGDSVLALLVNEFLYHDHPGHSEGQLTKLKARYVCEPSLAEAAAALHLGDLLGMAAGDEVAGGRERPSTLSDAYEAVLAAVYLARGIEAARAFVHDTLIQRVDPTIIQDYKSYLQELFQERHKVTPAYRTRAESGPAHDRLFHSEVVADEKVLGQGSGRSKKVAEQAAAEDALSRLVVQPTEEPPPPDEETQSE